MRRASKFTVAPSWKVLFSSMQIDLVAALAYAKLPADLFNQHEAVLSPAEYCRFWIGLDQAAGERELALLLSQYLTAESFDAPIFASLCSPDFNTAVQRISQYKPLIGPMILDIEQTADITTLNISCYGHDGPLPYALSMGELVFFTQLIRLATRHPVVPVAMTAPDRPTNWAPYQHYFGTDIQQGDSVSISFSAEDAARPFLMANASMWDFFESHLKQRLADLEPSASTAERVRAVLLEALPSGESSIEWVANKLAMSKRTLQRKLSAEAESFQSVLQTVRTELADHYLEKSHMSLGEISFLLGFQESNSFIRAYSTWKGISPGHYRESLH